MDAVYPEPHGAPARLRYATEVRSIGITTASVCHCKHRHVVFGCAGGPRLGTLGGRHSVAYAINDAGQVVGGADTSDGRRQAFLWQDGTMTGLFDTFFHTGDAR